MRIRFPDTPVIRTQSTSIPAACYNQIRLALLRHRQPIQVLLGIQGLEVDLSDKVWLCRDLNLDSVPLLAWTSFANGGRSSLVAPVQCEVLHYHPYGGVVMRTVIPVLQRRMEELLTRITADRKGIASVLCYPLP